MAVVVAYAYPYAQVIYLRWSPGHVASPAAGLVLVTLAAGLSLVSLLTMGRLFGAQPGFERSGDEWTLQIRPPPDVSFVQILADIGYNLQEWNFVTLLLVLVGWMSLVYRIHAEERALSLNMPNGQPTQPWCATAYSPVFGESPFKAALAS